LRAEAQQDPDERAFHAGLARGPFQLGVDEGRWRIVDVDWPRALIAISAARRPRAPDEYLLRFELAGYPHAEATATPWHSAEDRPLTHEERPKGGRATLAFRTDWENGRALYIPCDRVAIDSHPHWRTEHPGWLWSPTEGIVRYLRLIHDILNEDDYQGI
jgi:hypothetical protein